MDKTFSDEEIQRIRDRKTEQLKPCPFCGGVNLEVRRGGCDDEVAYIFCKGCEAGGPSSMPRDDRGSSADQWNVRYNAELTDEEKQSWSEFCESYHQL